MCGRYALTDIEQIKELVPIEGQMPMLAPMYNIAPSARMPVITFENEFKVQLMQWNFLPRWASTDYKPLINARAESIDSKPYFKESFEKRRCIIPATGFYEWQHQTKQPYYIHVSDQPIFGFAGIYDFRKDAEDRSYGAFAIITTSANGRVTEIHHRMPVILHREDLLHWLKGNPSNAKQLLVPYDTDQTIATPVSKSVNNPSINQPELINSA